ncbi:MAG TPA: hypothetical protein VI356_05715 [Myxococcales bacterium]
MRDKEQIRKRRVELRREFKDLYREVARILFEEDPIRINFETNSDEYEAEAGTILPRLRGCSGVEEVRAVVHEEFVRWFGADIAGTGGRYGSIAEKIWAAIRKEQEQSPSKGTDVGRLFVWTYPDGRKSFSGWHLTADGVACTRLFRAIEGLSEGSLSGPQAFPVSAVTSAVLAVPNNRHAKARSARELRVATAEEPRHFSLEEHDEVLTITAGRERLDELRKNINGITRNQGDFAMVPDGKRRAPDQALWFWWLLSQL